MNTPRNGSVRGTGPKRPGDLTGRTFAQNQARIEAEKRVREAPPVNLDAIEQAAYKRGYDKGYYDGIQWVGDNYDVFPLAEDQPDEE